MTTVMLWSQAARQAAIARLLRDDVVAIPTETVYGLAARMTSDDAVARVFEWKGRPRQNPLIVHVRDLEQGRALVRLNPLETRVFDSLARKFWPGPLTLVTPRAPHVPPRITAGGDYVGLRCPAHPVAQALLASLSEPLVAPSANLSGHVSPTTAAHVAADFHDKPLLILDGGPCSVGVESTVVKVLEDGAVVILRDGFVRASELEECLAQAGIPTRIHRSADHVASASGAEALLAPGQLLTHYSPRLPTYLCDASGVDGPAAPRASAALNEVVVLDFGSTLLAGKARFLAYRDLSRDRDPRSAEASLYEALRWTETVEGAKALLVPVLPESEPFHALRDRLHRAASGRKARVNFAVDRAFF